MTLAVIDGSNNLREFQEDLTLVLSDAYAFTARHGTRTEITRYEPAKEFNFTALNHDDNLEVRILKIIRQIESNRLCCLKRAACLSERRRVGGNEVENVSAHTQITNNNQPPD